MSARDWLTLSRPSNLPTVWTDVLAGAVIAGGALGVSKLALLMLAGSIFYCAGMILNDAFDRDIDARERPERPIPAGRVLPAVAFTVGFLWLAAAIYAAYFAAPKLWTLLAAVVLAAAIVLYDMRHKKNPVAPFIMGLCRALLYVLAAVAVAPPGTELHAITLVALPAFALWAWVVGLTYVARAEAKGQVPKLALALLSVPTILAGVSTERDWITIGMIIALVLWTGRSIFFAQQRRIGPAIVALIAGISLVDAVALASSGSWKMAIAACLGAPLTLRLQKFVRGT